MYLKKSIVLLTLIFVLFNETYCQEIIPGNTEIKSAMKRATEFVSENLSQNGGYVWFYLPDMSRRWGEMEAYPSMAWVQGAGTVGMGNTFLDAYEITGDEYYYSLAETSALSLIKGQLSCGGWNYLIDYSGEESIKKWYSTIGKNGWRLEEFQHYYGNATFDDEATEGAADFLLRVYLVKKNDDIKNALDKAIDFILRAQYPNGAWPQRFPEKDKFNKNGNPDYSLYYTFNDNVIWNNTKFLIKCYEIFGEQKFVKPIERAMNFFIISQHAAPQAGWAMQYSLDMQPAGARSYEPKALDPQFTARHIEILIKLYEMTGDQKFLAGIPAAIDWINSVKIDSQNNDLLFTAPKFVELGTNKFLYLHRKGTNVGNGKYFYDYNNTNLVSHYNSIRIFNFRDVILQYEKVKTHTAGKSRDSVLNIPGMKKDQSQTEKFKLADAYLMLNSESMEMERTIGGSGISNIINSMNPNGSWFTKHVFISNPYVGAAASGNPDTEEFTKTRVGDKFDTSPYEDTSDQDYISTYTYMRNMRLLISALQH